MSKLDLLLNPVRMRILINVAGRHITAAELIERMPDVPQTTLYRHLRQLLEGGILQVVGEKQIRGSVEKTYALIEGGGRVDPATLNAEQREQAFTYFLMTLIAQFQQAVTLPNAPIPQFRMTALHATPDQLATLMQRLENDFQPETTTPNEGATRYILAGIVLPDTTQG